MHVSLYHTTRHYGGPEEGGWYYDRSAHQRVIVSGLSADEALAEARRRNAQAAEERKADGRSQGRFSVLGGADEVYLPEDVPGEHDDSDEPTPHYE